MLSFDALVFMGQVSSQKVEEAFGTPAMVVIVALVAVIVFLFREWRKAQEDNNAQRDLRLQDSREILDSIKKPLATQAEISEKMYDLLVENLSNSSNKRGR